jgi:hypothetical protein
MNVAAAWKGTAAFAGLLALLCQLFAAVVSGSAATATNANPRLRGFDAPHCHADETSPAHQGDGKPASCLSCPLCQLAVRSAITLPSSPEPVRRLTITGIQFYQIRFVPRLRDCAIGEAAPPRGPPAALRSLA